MKRVLSIVLAALMVLSVAIPSVLAAPAVNESKYPAGTIIPGGSDGWYDVYTAYGADLYPINTADDLIAFAESTDTFSGKTVILTNDITLPSGHNWTPKQDFAGTFDGNGCKIIGLNSQTVASGTNEAGETVYKNAGGLVNRLSGVIKDLSIVDSTIYATNKNPYYAGTFAGDAGNATIINCYTNATVKAERTNVAGMVGHMTGALTIRNSHFDGIMDSTSSYNGGFVGNQESNPLYLSDCLNTGTISANGNVAGFSDSVYHGNLMAYRCVNMGKVSLKNGTLMPPIGGTVGAALTATLLEEGVTTAEQHAGGGASRGAATYVDCYTLEGMASTEYWYIRSHSTVNGIGPTVDQAHDELTDEQKAQLSAIVTTFTKKDYADMLKVLGNAWTLDENGELALSQRKDVDVDSKSVYISTYDQLVAWANSASDDEGKIIVLTADITANSGTASTWATSAPSKVWSSKKNFAGTFDGNGHSISGLYGDALIETLNGGIIKDLSIVNSYINSNSNAGTFADVAKDSRIEACYTNAIVKGNTSGNNLGGIVGTLEGMLTIVETQFDGTVDTQGRYAAGFVANLNGQALIVTDCINSGAVTGWQNAAGITDGVGNGVLYATRCINTGKITVINENRASTAAGAGITKTIGTDSAKGEAFFVDCYVDRTACTYGGYTLLSGSVANGSVVGTTAAAINTQVSTFAKVNAKWTLSNSKPAFVKATSESFNFISSYADLLAWKANGSTDAGKTYVLTADIVINTGDAATWETKAPSVSWSNKDFNGTLDGNGFSISGLYGQPLVNVLNGTIKNLSIVNSFINKGNTSGTFAARTRSAYIINCYTNAYVFGTSNNVGGFVGDMAADTNGQKATLTITNSQFDGFVRTPNTYAGGFVANQQSQHVVAIDCLNTGRVHATGCLAGISESMYGGTLTAIRCVNAGEIAGIRNADAADGSYKKYDKTGTYFNGIGAICSAGSSATMFDCHSVTGISNSNRWDFRASGTTYSYLNGQSSLSKSDYPKYINGFGTNEFSEIAAAMGAFYGYENGKLIIRDLPTNEDYIRIANYEDLVAWATNGSDDAGKTVVLAADIVANVGSASDFKTKAPAKVWKGKNFAGTFEGGGNVISGLYGNTGLFSSISGTAKVLNVQLKNSYFSSSGVIAAIVGSVSGSNANVAIRNCYTNAIVEGVNHCGGILGYGNNNTNTVTITGCWNDGPVTIVHSGGISDGTGRYASGIFGNQGSCHAVISNCLNSGTITAYRNVSGISNAVYNGSLIVTNCINSGKIVVTCNPADFSNDISTKAHATLGVVESEGVVTVTNCYGMEGASVVNQFTKTSKVSGADVSFPNRQQYYLLDKLGLANWGVQWLNRSQPVVAPAAFTTTYERTNGFQFVENGDGTATVTSYRGSGEKVTIPSLFNGMQVTNVGAFAFQMVNVKNVIIPEGVTQIDANAFRDSGVLRVTLPSTLETISDEAFYGSSLIEISVPDSVTTIGDGAFMECTELASAELPAEMDAIGSDAFHGCSALKSIDASALTEIADGAFMGCSSLTTVNVSDSLTKIGTSSFNGCTSLMMAALPAAVTEVGAYAFADCAKLTDVLASQNVAILGDGAFKDCDSLNYVVLSDKLTVVPDALFFGCDALTYVSVPESVNTIGANAFAYCSKLERASIPEAVTTIGDGAFRGCDTLESVMIPEGVVTIGAYAFYGDSALLSVQLPATLKLVDEYAFHNCSALTDVVYTGTDAQWAMVNVRTGNAALTGADRENIDAIPAPSVPATSVVIPDNAPQVGIVGNEANAGSTVEVTVQLNNNSAVSALKLDLTYDSSVLSVNSVKNGALMDNALFQTGTDSDGSLILVWIGATNSTANGTLATVVFNVAADAAAGDTAVGVEVLEASNAAGKDVAMKTADGVVSVNVILMGDVNDDGIVDGADLTILVQYLTDWAVEISEETADCNGDGVIDLADCVRLTRYLNDWDVVLG